ncbi:MAG: IRE (iron responsive element), partial [Planctomycetota bacterium]
INYEYWKTLSIAEQEERTIRARRLIYEAEKANADAELKKATELYEEAFDVWAEILDDYPVLIIDDTADDLMDSIKKYSIVIDSEDFGDDFPLQPFIDVMGEDRASNVELYEQFRETQREKIELRKLEVEAEENARAEKVAAEQAIMDEASDGEEPEDSESGSDGASASADDAEAEGSEAEADAGEADSESDSEGSSSDDED